ncbi:hypothetical protein PQC40_gp048 [Escherichia phage EP335]|uniref:Uncharacterized protein n=1 Tax=Escherichia phage EP335 TaxID=2070199 RepID=A0A2Z3DNT0_9CAUD|nr:hypothetical protein PQC40_gp048 [Escherichia phage EP335]AVZ45131.1 hypothetical protein [Escherichia phage EP335]
MTPTYTYKTWVVVSETGRIVSLDARLCIYEKENKAIQEAAWLIKTFPNKSFSIKHLEIPQMAE